MCLTVSLARAFCIINKKMSWYRVPIGQLSSNGEHIVSSYKSNFLCHLIKAFLLYCNCEQESAAALERIEHLPRCLLISLHSTLGSVSQYLMSGQAVTPGVMCDTVSRGHVTLSANTKYKEIFSVLRYNLDF